MRDSYADSFLCLLYRNSEPANLAAFADHLAGNYVPNSVIVDATASEVPAEQYLEWMQKGIHIITPNKKLNSGPLPRYRELKKFQRESYIHFLYEVQYMAHACVARTAGRGILHENRHYQ